MEKMVLLFKKKTTFDIYIYNTKLKFWKLFVKIMCYKYWIIKKDYVTGESLLNLKFLKLFILKDYEITKF